MTDLTCPSCGESVPTVAENHAASVVTLAHSEATSCLTIEARGIELRMVVRGGGRQGRADIGYALLLRAIGRWRKG